MRWLAELGNARLKCERLGHRVMVQWRKGWIETTDFCAVAERVRQERLICRRCDEALSDWAVTDSTPLTGLTASDTAWEDIRAGGHWFARGWAPADAEKGS